jgi:hypothetical protein
MRIADEVLASVDLRDEARTGHESTLLIVE